MHILLLFRYIHTLHTHAHPIDQDSAMWRHTNRDTSCRNRYICVHFYIQIVGMRRNINSIASYYEWHIICYKNDGHNVE